MFILRLFKLMVGKLRIFPHLFIYSEVCSQVGITWAYLKVHLYGGAYLVIIVSTRNTVDQVYMSCSTSSNHNNW